MSVFFTNDNNELFVNCHCGCDEGVHLKIQSDEEDTDFAFLTYSNGNFYRDQHSIFSTLCKKFKKIWAILCNKDYYYSEIIMSREDFEKFRLYINSIK